MSAYTNYDEDVNIAPHGEEWVLLKDLTWEVGGKGSKLPITVPKGFLFDGPSIPWWARTVFKTSDGRWWLASAIHDYLLSIKNFSRVTAAAEFANALQAKGVEPWRARIGFLAVYFYTTRDEG